MEGAGSDRGERRSYFKRASQTSQSMLGKDSWE
jgi:hypothetical protein